MLCDTFVVPCSICTMFPHFCCCITHFWIFTVAICLSMLILWCLSYLSTKYQSMVQLSSLANQLASKMVSFGPHGFSITKFQFPRRDFGKLWLEDFMRVYERWDSDTFYFVKAMCEPVRKALSKKSIGDGELRSGSWPSISAVSWYQEFKSRTPLGIISKLQAFICRCLASSGSPASRIYRAALGTLPRCDVPPLLAAHYSLLQIEPPGLNFRTIDSVLVLVFLFQYLRIRMWIFQDFTRMCTYCS